MKQILDRKRKGITYVEIMISFAIFISLLIAIFLFIRPIREPQLSSVLLDIAEAGLEKNGTIALTSIPFRIGSVSGGIIPIPGGVSIDDCFSIEHPLNVGTGKDQLQENNIFLKDKDGKDVEFNIDSTKMLIPKIGGFYTIYFSFDETFVSNTLDCDKVTQIASPDAAFSSPRVETLFSRNKLEELKSKYDTDYEGLKQEWFLPDESGFSITVTLSDDATINMEKVPPAGKNVFSRDITFHMLEQETTGEITTEQIDIKIKVW